MNVGQLIQILSKFDSNLNVGVLHDNGIFLAEEAGLYEGTLHVPMGNKMIYNKIKARYVVIGNPGNYDLPAYHEENAPLKVYDDFS